MLINLGNFESCKRWKNSIKKDGRRNWESHHFICQVRRKILPRFSKLSRLQKETCGLKKWMTTKNAWCNSAIHIQFRMHSTTEYCSLVAPLDPKTTFQSRSTKNHVKYWVWLPRFSRISNATVIQHSAEIFVAHIMTTWINTHTKRQTSQPKAQASKGVQTKRLLSSSYLFFFHSLA